MICQECGNQIFTLHQGICSACVSKHADGTREAMRLGFYDSDIWEEASKPPHTLDCLMCCNGWVAEFGGDGGERCGECGGSGKIYPAVVIETCPDCFGTGLDNQPHDYEVEMSCPTCGGYVDRVNSFEHAHLFAFVEAVDVPNSVRWNLQPALADEDFDENSIPF